MDKSALKPALKTLLTKINNVVDKKANLLEQRNKIVKDVFKKKYKLAEGKQMFKALLKDHLDDIIKITKELHSHIEGKTGNKKLKSILTPLLQLEDIISNTKTIFDDVKKIIDILTTVKGISKGLTEKFLAKFEGLEWDDEIESTRQKKPKRLEVEPESASDIEEAEAEAEKPKRRIVKLKVVRRGVKKPVVEEVEPPKLRVVDEDIARRVVGDIYSSITEWLPADRQVMPEPPTRRVVKIRKIKREPPPIDEDTREIMRLYPWASPYPTETKKIPMTVPRRGYTDKLTNIKNLFVDKASQFIRLLTQTINEFIEALESKAEEDYSAFTEDEINEVLFDDVFERHEKNLYDFFDSVKKMLEQLEAPYDRLYGVGMMEKTQILKNILDYIQNQVKHMTEEEVKKAFEGNYFVPYGIGKKMIEDANNFEIQKPELLKPEEAIVVYISG